MHSKKSAEKRISELIKGKETFMQLSRELAKNAQNRESLTVQPKEKLSGVKATLTIKNYLGGLYYFTADEIHIKNDNLFLIEGKHSKQSLIPSSEDIKDGLVKMILFTNLKDVKIGDKEYSPIAALKLTSEKRFSVEELSKSQLKQLRLLKEEAEKNKFYVTINDINLRNIKI